LKFLLEVIFRTGDYGTLSLTFLPCNGLLGILDQLVPCRESRQLCNINSFPASQVETVEVETFLLSSQGSRIVSVEKSSIVPSSLVRALNLQILKIKRGSTPRIDRSSFATLLSVAITSVKRKIPSFSRFAPQHGRLFRPLSAIVISVTTVRRHDVALPSISATVFTTPRSRELTLLSAVLPTPDTRLGQLTVTVPHRL
jgi:hypothetical protein